MPPTDLGVDPMTHTDCLPECATPKSRAAPPGSPTVSQESRPDSKLELATAFGGSAALAMKVSSAMARMILTPREVIAGSYCIGVTLAAASADRLLVGRTSGAR